MKKIVLILLSALLCLGASAQKLNHFSRYGAANAALGEPQGPRVVLFGDSITDGWPGQRPDFFAETGFIGRGISGEETTQMLLRFRADVIDIKASVVVILAGINDIAYNLGDPYDENLTFSNIVSMTELAKYHGIRPVICSLLPSYNIRWRPELEDAASKVASINARLEKFCKENGITYVNYFQALAGEDGWKIRPELSPDTVHPNADGYAVMEAVLLKALCL